tara:strand:+ start:261 stop:2204 length:1944 start_codon:yes stop_codon:yes gene_type:complete
MVEYMNQQLQNPEFAREYQETQTRFRAALAQNLNANGANFNRRTPIIIPVAVHFPSGLETDRTCLEALVQNQIDILNADFTATNSDANLWSAASSFYPGVNHGTADIKFCIATSNHPSGLDAELLEGNPAVTIGYNFGNGNNRDPNWSGYMNFVVKNLGASLLGQSPLGGSVSAGQSVEINLNAFGSGSGCSGSGIVPRARFDLGRTVTHELGHFYNLKHTFSGSCGTDDGLSDTPNISSSNGSCPSNGSVAGCVNGEKALTMNYMDYVNDACMFMFTEGQTEVVDAYISTLQNQFKPNTTSCGTASFSVWPVNSSYRTCGNEATFDLNYFAVNGYNSTVLLEVSNAPQGATVTLSQDTIDSSSGDFSLTLTNIDELALADYTVTVTATGAGLSESVDLTLSIVDSICRSEGSLEFVTATTAVIFSNINNLDRSSKTVPYNDFTSISTDINRESSYELSVHVNTDGNYEVATKVWIDWNQNCSFGDAGELYDLGVNTDVFDGSTTHSPLAIVIPSDAELGTTTMRVFSKLANVGSNVSACQMGFDGEVEDYTVNVLPSIAKYNNELIDLGVFPNPNNGSFTLKFVTNTTNDFEVSVFDIRGRRIYTKNFENRINFNQTINLDRTQSGVYLMTVSSSSDQVTKRIIIN